MSGPDLRSASPLTQKHLRLEARVHELAALFPSVVQLESIGETHEGRPIRSVRLGAARSKSGKVKPAVVISAGSHAREVSAPGLIDHPCPADAVTVDRAGSRAALHLFAPCLVRSHARTRAARPLHDHRDSGAEPGRLRALALVASRSAVAQEPRAERRCTGGVQGHRHWRRLRACRLEGATLLAS
jgi:hypothetical protein